MADPNAPALDPNAPLAEGDPPAPASGAPSGADPAPPDPGAGGSGGEDTGSSAAGETPPSPPVAVEDSIAAAPKREDWREAKIRRLTAQLHELRDKPLAETPEVPLAPVADPAVRLQEAEIERRARVLASQQNAIDTFNRMCREAATAGRVAFPDFDTRVTALREAFAGGEEDVQQQIIYNQFVAAALETGSAPALLHRLGGDLDEAARIMALSPIKMAVELTRLAGKAPDTSTTRAPKPITPVGSKGAAHTAIAPDDPERADNLPTAEWMKRRNEQEKTRAEAGGRR